VQMKIHLDPGSKQVSIEGDIKLADLFNRLMSWFPEEWEDWTLIAHKPTIQYKEVIVDRTWWRDPYWNPYKPYQIPITYDGTSLTTIETGTDNTFQIDLSQVTNSTSLIASNTNQSLTLNLNNI